MSAMRSLPLDFPSAWNDFTTTLPSRLCLVNLRSPCDPLLPEPSSSRPGLHEGPFLCIFRVPPLPESQLCGASANTNKFPSSSDTTGCPTSQFNSDTNHPDYMSESTGYGLSLPRPPPTLTPVTRRRLPLTLRPTGYKSGVSRTHSLNPIIPWSGS